MVLPMYLRLSVNAIDVKFGLYANVLFIEEPLYMTSFKF